MRRAARFRLSAGAALHVSLLPLLPGCAPAAARSRSTLYLAQRTDVNSLDPAIAYDTVSIPLTRLICQGLLDYGDGTDLVPRLAKSLPSISPDGRTYVFHLKEGQRFSNGREVEAGDFVYSLERVLDPATKSPGEAFFRKIAGATEFQAAREKDAAGALQGAARPRRAAPIHVAGLRAPDRYTLEIRLTEPDLSFSNIMAMSFAYAVPREEAEARGEDFGVRPAGSGPYVLEKWRRGAWMRLTRNPRYAGSDRPRFGAVDVLVGADELVQQMMFERGELDYLPQIAEPDYARVTSDPRLSQLVESAPTNSTVYLAMNCELPPFTDRRVRQALNCAVDKERLVKILNGRGRPAQGVLPPRMPGYNPRLKGYAYDPERAKALLAQAGYPEGLTVPLWTMPDFGYAKIAEAVQQDLAAVGVKAELKPVALAMIIEAMGKRKNLPLVHTSWSQDYPDPSNFLDVLLSGKRIVDTHCNNVAFYANPEVDELLAQAARDTDAAHRLKLYQEVEEKVVADAPWVFLFHSTQSTLHQPWLHGAELHPVWLVRYERFWKDGA